MYSSEQYSVHRFSICHSSVRPFPERSWTVVDFPRSVTSWYALLLLFFLGFSSVSLHCSPIQFSLAFFLHRLMLLFGQGSGQVLWTYTGRKTLPPSTSLPVMGKIAGINTASLGGYFHSTKTRARWAEGFLDELNGHVFDLERDGLRQVVLCPRLTMR